MQFLLIVCITIAIPISQCRTFNRKFNENVENVLQDDILERIKISQEDKPVFKNDSFEPERLFVMPTKDVFNPPDGSPAERVRYAVHYLDWTVISAINSRYPGYPSATPMSYADYKGVPYIFVTKLDPTVQDLEKNPKASFVYSYSQTDYCRKKNYDNEDPRCGKIFLSGKVVVVPEDEISIAKKVLFAKHPIMRIWQLMPFHAFYFAKLEISRVSILDHFGGRVHVSLEDYNKVNI